MPRPEIAAVSASADIADWYWTRTELNLIARRLGVTRTGSKADVTARLVAVLEGAEPPVTTRRHTVAGLQPPFHPTDVVPRGQRMTQALRAFLIDQVGSGFRFDAVMRQFFADPAGRTLADAVELWRATRGVQPEIPAQFEYNRFTRAYRAQHRGATAAQVRAAWAEYKATPISARSRV